MSTVNPTVQGRLARAESDAHKRNLLALRQVMSEAQGRRVLWWLIEYAGVFSGLGNGDALPYLSGKRDMGVDLLAWCQEASPTLYVEMLMDRLREQEEERVRASEAEKEGERDG